MTRSEAEDRYRIAEAPGRETSLPRNSGRAAGKVCPMLFLRCTHHRPCYALLHEFHRTRLHLRRFGGAFQIDPSTAQARAEPDLKPPSPSRLRPRSHGRKTKKLRAGRQSIEKSDGKGCISDPPKLQIHNRSVYPRVVEGDHGMGCRFARNKKGRQSSQNAPTEREAHPSASGNAGG